jgi:hypothetical protein
MIAASDAVIIFCHVAEQNVTLKRDVTSLRHESANALTFARYISRLASAGFARGADHLARAPIQQK